MKWDELTETYCREQGCSTNQIMAAKMNPTANYDEPFRLEKKRKEIEKAALAVRTAYAQNPNMSRQQLRRQSYKFILGGALLLILIQALISVVIKMAIEWFIDRIMEQREENANGVQVSTE